MKLISYLNFDGNCREAMTYYGGLLGGEVTAMHEFGTMPMPDGQSLPAERQTHIMHASVTAGDQVLMGSDSAPHMPYRGVHGFAVSIATDSVEEAERIYDGLKDGATIDMPLGETFFSRRFAMLKDRFGTPWMINCDGAPS